MSIGQLPERITHLTSATWNAGYFCYLAITRDRSFRYVANRVPDPVYARDPIQRSALSADPADRIAPGRGEVRS